MNHTESFHLSHHDCDALRASFDKKADEALDKRDFDASHVWQSAVSLLHEARMKAWQDRADRRRIKRQKQFQPLDSRACHD